jgi:hypothetical protein
MRHIQSVLRCLMGEKLAPTANWIDYVRTVEKLLNERPDKARGGFSHKELFLGIKPRRSIKSALRGDNLGYWRDLSPAMESPEFEHYMKALEDELAETRAICRDVWLKRRSARQDARASDYNIRPTLFSVGDFVLTAHVIPRTDKLHKLQANWKGPFRVTRVVNDWVYEVEDIRSFPTPGKITLQHSIRLRFYADGSLPITNELRAQAEYSISLFSAAKILGHRSTTSGDTEVHVKWLGLSAAETSRSSLPLVYAHNPLVTQEYLATLPPLEQQSLHHVLLQAFRRD